MDAVTLPRSRYFQVSNEAPAVKGGVATERSEAPLTGEGSAVARFPSGSGRAPLPLSLSMPGAAPPPGTDAPLHSGSALR
jgi:hypothetical protein